jgi:mannose-6-phosphate isomerase-like protein (cupin superfamily)
MLVRRLRFKVVEFEDAVKKARKLAQEKLDEGDNADEFVEIGDAEDVKFYVTAGKTIRELVSDTFHENLHDTFIYVLDGEMEFTFENGDKAVVKKGQCFVFPKHVMHRCDFKKMTIALEGAYEK